MRWLRAPVHIINCREVVHIDIEWLDARSNTWSLILRLSHVLGAIHLILLLLAI